MNYTVVISAVLDPYFRDGDGLSLSARVIFLLTSKDGVWVQGPDINEHLTRGLAESEAGC